MRSEATAGSVYSCQAPFLGTLTRCGRPAVAILRAEGATATSAALRADCESQQDEALSATSVTYGSEGEAHEGNSPTQLLDLVHRPQVHGWLIEHQVDLAGSEAGHLCARDRPPHWRRLGGTHGHRRGDRPYPETVGANARLTATARSRAGHRNRRPDALASQQQYAERLDQAGTIRDQARGVLEHAFGHAARSAAEPLVAEAERVLQAFTDLAAAWQQRLSVFLAEHPDVELLLKEQQAEQERARQQEASAARAHRLGVLIATSDDAFRQGLVDEGRRLLTTLEREFPDEIAAIDRLRLKLEQCVRSAKDAAARYALAQATEHQARGDLEAAVSVLEQVDVHGLPEETSQDVFGRWSDTCS